MSTKRARTVGVAVLIMTVGACGGSDQDGAAPASETASTVQPTDTGSLVETSVSLDTVSPDNSSVPPDPTSTEATLPVVTIEVVGTAVGGNSGGVGQKNTDTLSETIRNDDGSCSGWDGPGDAGRWTQGLENGAPVIIFDRDTDEVIGDGSITSSSWADVDPSNQEQWNCTFAFTAVVSKDVEAFKIKVADLQPWLAVSDSTDPGKYVASVDTKIELSRVSACTDREPGLPISEWHAVGQFWANGFSTLCSNGLVVAKIQRTCRPPNAASEYVTRVLDANDPSVVYEDASGLRVDPDSLLPDTNVIVEVVTGRPC